MQVAEAERCLGFVKAIMKELTEELPKTIEPSNGHGALADEHDPPEVRAAKDLASRYRLPYIDLLPHDSESPIDYDSFTQVPVDLMVRYQFVPLRRDARGLRIAMANPTDLEKLDECRGPPHPCDSLCTQPEP